MGEAKSRILAMNDHLPSLHTHVPMVGLAIRKLAMAASDQLGRDCYAHAELGRALLRDFQIAAQTVVGYAAWRVGPGSGDVIAHTPQATHAPEAPGLMYHAWLECAGVIIDFTSYQLTRKARELDIVDGGSTQVEWSPDHLLIPKHKTRRFHEVANAYKAGLVYYESRPELEAVLRPQFSIDHLDLHAARLILRNPDLRVLGPNYLAGAAARSA